MNAAIILMLVYLIVAFVLQMVGFGISKMVDYVRPSLSMSVFLLLYFCAFGLAWPIAVRLTEPKKVEDALESDLKILRSSGAISDFTVTHRDDGPYVRVTPGPNSPPDLRHAVALALQDQISEARISIAT